MPRMHCVRPKAKQAPIKIKKVKNGHFALQLTPFGRLFCRQNSSHDTLNSSQCHGKRMPLYSAGVSACIHTHTTRHSLDGSWERLVLSCASCFSFMSRDLVPRPEIPYRYDFLNIKKKIPKLTVSFKNRTRFD